MTENVKFTERGKSLVASLLSELDHHTARAIREGIDAMLFRTRPDVLEMDFSRVGFMDSSGIGLIIGRAELCSELGAHLVVTGMSSGLLRLVRLSGVEKLKNVSLVK